MARVIGVKALKLLGLGIALHDLCWVGLGDRTHFDTSSIAYVSA